MEPSSIYGALTPEINTETKLKQNECKTANQRFVSRFQRHCFVSLWSQSTSGSCYVWCEECSRTYVGWNCSGGYGWICEGVNDRVPSRRQVCKFSCNYSNFYLSTGATPRRPVLPETSSLLPERATPDNLATYLNWIIDAVTRRN